MKIQLKKVTNKATTNITIATFRFYKDALYNNQWELKTTKNAQNTIYKIIKTTDNKLNNDELTKILQDFKKDFGVGDKYCEQKLIVKAECDDFVYNTIDDDIIENLDEHDTQAIAV